MHQGKILAEIYLQYQRKGDKFSAQKFTQVFFYHVCLTWHDARKHDIGSERSIDSFV